MLRQLAELYFIPLSTFTGEKLNGGFYDHDIAVYTGTVCVVSNNYTLDVNRSYVQITPEGDALRGCYTSPSGFHREDFSGIGVCDCDGRQRQSIANDDEDDYNDGAEHIQQR